MIGIFKEFETDMTNIPPIEIIFHESNGCKHANILASQSKLFFIKYTLENILRQRWYLVQIYLETTLKVNKDHSARDSYNCVFLNKYPNNTSKSNEFNRL